MYSEPPVWMVLYEWEDKLLKPGALQRQKLPFNLSGTKDAFSVEFDHFDNKNCIDGIKEKKRVDKLKIM